MFKTSLGIAAATALLAVGAPAEAKNHVLKSTAIGAGAGALVGAVVPGMSTGTGALIGGGTGLAVGAITKNKHHNYRNRGYRTDSYGRRHYYR